VRFEILSLAHIPQSSSGIFKDLLIMVEYKKFGTIKKLDSALVISIFLFRIAHSSLLI